MIKSCKNLTKCIFVRYNSGMIIDDGSLLSISASDLDADGVLRIPDGVYDIAQNVGANMPNLRELYFPDSVRKLYQNAFANCPKLSKVFMGNGLEFFEQFALSNCPKVTTVQIPHSWIDAEPWIGGVMQNVRVVIRQNSRGEWQKIPITTIKNRPYFESKIHQIGAAHVSSVQKLRFDKDGLNEQPDVHLSINRDDNKYQIVGSGLAYAVLQCRRELLRRKFNAVANAYKAAHPNVPEKYIDILHNALEWSLCDATKLNVAGRKKFIKYINEFDANINYVNNIFAKYPNVGRKFNELKNINVDDLLKIIRPIPTDNPVSKSCTRWLKSRPVSASEMHAIVNAGYKNPGAFPYSWLKRIPAANRGAATQKLHDVLRNAAIEMYSPESDIAKRPLLDNLAKKLENIIGQTIQIKYLGTGAFSKTYTMQIPGDKKYVWKIYHCDVNNGMMHSNMHDTELQNSFLLGGARYTGKAKFRNISVAGISNQRGETYMIYPYTDGASNKISVPQKRFQETDAYVLGDTNPENIINNTIIDMGSIDINRARWDAPKYVSKIMRTVLYNSWNDLGYVLNNYNSAQIGMALSFLGGKISHWDIDYNKIMAKIEFLKRRARIR